MSGKGYISRTALRTYLVTIECIKSKNSSLYHDTSSLIRSDQTLKALIRLHASRCIPNNYVDISLLAVKGYRAIA